MSDRDVVALPRLLTPADAARLVGDDVPNLAPTVTRPTIAVDAATREPVFAYLPLAGAAELRRAVVAPSPENKPGKSRTFGYAPRRPIFGREGCTVTKLASTAETAHARRKRTEREQAAARRPRQRHRQAPRPAGPVQEQRPPDGQPRPAQLHPGRPRAAGSPSDTTRQGGRH